MDKENNISFNKTKHKIKKIQKKVKKEKNKKIFFLNTHITQPIIKNTRL